MLEAARSILEWRWMPVASLTGFASLFALSAVLLAPKPGAGGLFVSRGSEEAEAAQESPAIRSATNTQQSRPGLRAPLGAAGMDPARLRQGTLPMRAQPPSDPATVEPPYQAAPSFVDPLQRSALVDYQRPPEAVQAPVEVTLEQAELPAPSQPEPPPAGESAEEPQADVTHTPGGEPIEPEVAAGGAAPAAPARVIRRSYH